MKHASNSPDETKKKVQSIPKEIRLINITKRLFIAKRLSVIIYCFFLISSIWACHSAFAAEITLIPGKKEETDLIILQGDIVEGDDIKFKKIAFNVDKAVVVLNSPGGLILPSLEIGKSLHFKEFGTAVINSECASACALIWLAGTPRAMTTSAYIGFHAVWHEQKDGQKEAASIGNALVGSYLHSLGLNENVVAFVTAAKPSEILRLNKADADRLNLPVELLNNGRKARANHHLALSHRFGKTPNIREAVRYYRLAAEDGFAGSQNNLGDLYEDGIGVPQNDKFAIYWYTRAAERGEPTAYLSLCTLLPSTSNDPDVLVESLKYAILAVNGLPEGNNKKKAAAQLLALASKLTEDQKRHASELANSYTPLYQEQHLMSDSPKK